MKVFRHSILLLFALLCGLQGQAQQQRFFNLTVDDIAIDTMLPRFSYAIPLGKHYADSIYMCFQLVCRHRRSTEYG